MFYRAINEDTTDVVSLMWFNLVKRESSFLGESFVEYEVEVMDCYCCAVSAGLRLGVR